MCFKILRYRHNEEYYVDDETNEDNTYEDNSIFVISEVNNFIYDFLKEIDDYVFFDKNDWDNIYNKLIIKHKIKPTKKNLNTNYLILVCSSYLKPNKYFEKYL